MNAVERINHFLLQRNNEHLFRKLIITNDLIDLSSNDYLGLSRSAFIRQQVQDDFKNYQFHKSGATGSRLLNGNSLLCEEIEGRLAQIHHAEAALLFNSGFDANVGLISTVIRPKDTIFYDEMVHASIHQGMRLSGAKLIPYKHNQLGDLIQRLNNSDYDIAFLITESVFSMDGDKANLSELAEICAQFRLNLIVDEAHAGGLFGINGSGLCNVSAVEEKCFARIYTFGKAIASHGAAILGTQLLKDYLINFSKNFIYTTALDTHNLLSVKHSYNFIQSNRNQFFKLNTLNNYFYLNVKKLASRFEVCGEGPIFGIIVPGNKNCKEIARYLQMNKLDVRAILSPTVPLGRERLRVVLHSFNTKDEIDRLFSLLLDYKTVI